MGYNYAAEKTNLSISSLQITKQLTLRYFLHLASNLVENISLQKYKAVAQLNLEENRSNILKLPV